MSPGGGQLIEQMYSSPYPPPELVRQFNDIKPGAAEEILAVAISQIRHQQEIELRNLKINEINIRQEFNITIIGQITSFLTILICIGACVYLAIKDKPIQSLGPILASLAVIVGAIIYQKKQDKVQ